MVELLGKGRMVAVTVGRAEELVTKPEEAALLEMMVVLLRWPQP